MPAPHEDTQTPPHRLALTGASGFVGTHLRRRLISRFDVCALTRSESVASQTTAEAGFEWKKCDLYSLPELVDALRGCQSALYLVHSMAPSSRLTQASFEELDLLLADNFIRAAETAGVEHVIYLGGLLPDQETQLSPHLRSRREVEKVLRSRSVKVTVLRAGLIFGPGGSSFTMLVNLVRRLPFMLLPAWVKSRTHSIDIADVEKAFELVLTKDEFKGGTFDLGGHHPMTYRELIHSTARGLGRPVRTLDLPFNLLRLSQHWVSLFSGLPVALVAPLQESLRHDLQAQPNRLLDALTPEMTSFEESLQKSIGDDGRALPNPRQRTQRTDRKLMRKERRVRSVQRMPLPVNWNAERIADAYGSWLTRKFRGLVNVVRDEDGMLRFLILNSDVALLELTPTPLSRANQRRRAFFISGGLLCRQVDPPGRFEFRLFPESNCLIASIHGFSPALPWWIYTNSQALIHLWVMKAFGKFLSAQ